MLDIKFIRDNLDTVKKAVFDKNVKVDLDNLIQLDDQRRKLIIESEALRSRRNEISNKLKGGKDDALVAEGKELKEKLGKLETQLEEVEKGYYAEMLRVPNIPAPGVPVGKDETENQVVESWGDLPAFDFKPKEHLEIGQALGIIDVDSAANVAGSRFAYLLGGAAHLQFALIQFVLKTLTDAATVKKIADRVEPGYNAKVFSPAVPPVMIKSDVYVKAARLSEEDKNERYYLEADDLYLIGSAEHTLVTMHMDKVIPMEQLPLRYIGYSTAFRREAGSYGKDVKGIIRVHQFDKLEMESFSLPEDSYKEHLLFVAIEEYILQALNIPYQKVLKCTGDIGMPNARGIDIEAWMPGQGKYRETHTADMMTDFQARRLNIRVKRTTGQTEFVHTNDATALAIGRAIVAILENYQQADGSVLIPEVLKPYIPYDRITK